MCGIAGIFELGTPRLPSAETLRGLMRGLARRGPDDADLTIEAGIGLAATRLAIVDRVGGRQPFKRPSSGISVVWNGEIDNHADLRTELIAVGVPFTTESDTEVVAAAYETWGVDAFAKFRGMYAIAVFDRGRGTLLLARDPIGEKPLYVADLGGASWAFASEPGPLIPLLGTAPAIDRDAVADLLALGAIAAPRSLFRGIRQLLPGECRLFRLDGSATPTSTFIRPPIATDATVDGDDPAALEAVLRNAVASCLKPGVPAGVFLSGGIDSALVAAFARDCRPDLPTYTVSFDEPQFDESAAAAAVARHLGLTHRIVPMPTPTEADVAALADTWSDPFADASAWAFREVCSVASRDIKIALTGDGGDEGFAGYDRHRGFGVLAAMRKPVLGQAFGAALRLATATIGGDRLRRLRRAWEAFPQSASDAWFALRCMASDVDRHALCADPTLASAVAARADFAATFATTEGISPVDRARMADLVRYLPDDLCVKSDRGSMAFGLEARAPFLDLEVLRLAFGRTKKSDSGLRFGKRRLRALASRFLPTATVHARKRGFGVPIADWLRGPLRESLIALIDRPHPAREGLFRDATLRSWIEEHVAGRVDRGPVLWALVVLDATLTRHIPR